MNAVILRAAATSLSLSLAILQAHAQQSPIPAPVEQPAQISSQRVQIEAGTGDGSASIGFQLPSPTSSVDDIGPDLRRVTSDRLNLILSTPWNGEDDAEPLNLGGPTNGTTLTFRWGRFVSFTRRGTQPPAIAAEIRNAAENACREAAVRAFDDERRRLGILTLNPTPEEQTPEEQARLRVLEVRRDLSLSECGQPRDSFLDLIGRHQPDRLREYVASLIPRAPYELGFEASIGHREFNFVDPTTLAALDETKVEWGVRAYYSWYALRSRTAFTLAAGYQRSYEAADEEVFCPANPNNIVVQCTTAAGGPPELDESLLLSAGLRHQFEGTGLLSNLAIAPLFTFDALDGAWGADLPIYLLPNADSGLIGGLRFGYRSDREDEFSVGIFIGAAFNILN